MPRQSTKVSQNCEQCGKPFTFYPCSYPEGRKFCSLRCWALTYRRPPTELFNGFIDRSGDCWLWTGGTYKNGYGAFHSREWETRKPHNHLAHRYSFELANGPIPKGLDVCHSCDVNYPKGDITYRRCVNPEHLYLGTTASNVRRAWDVGRREPSERIIQGEDHWCSKLTEDDVRSIRAEYDPALKNGVALARRFGVGHAMVYAILRRDSWKHLTEH